ncbi:apolipoprotein N-acyltransferase [bacterium]|nr:apolipoprotein N-acyltransferase [bacterium]
MRYRNSLILAASAGILLAFPPFHLEPLILISLVPLLIAIRTTPTGKAAFFTGWGFGFLTMLGLHRWMWALTPFAPVWTIAVVWVIFSAYLALFYGAGTWAIRRLPSIPLFVTVPAIWTLIEYTRLIGPIGNPAGMLGYGLIDLFPLNQIASVGGVLLLTFGVALINSLVAEVIIHPGLRKLVLSFTIFVVFGIWLGSGLLLDIKQTQVPAWKSVTVSIIQGNHPQTAKESQASWATIESDYLMLSDSIPESSESQWILWPETITPTLMLNNPTLVTAIKKIAQKKSAILLFGSPIQSQSRYYNAIVGISPEGETLPPYKKHLLMPFGEYWPAKSVFQMVGLDNLVGTDYSTDTEIKPMPITSEISVAGAICLESLYPFYTREAVSKGANAIVVVANNAWFFNSIAAQMHLNMTRMRAIETRRWAVIAANTGLSAVIAPSGQIIRKSQLNHREILRESIKLQRTQTPYVTLGNWIVWISIMILMISSGVAGYYKFKNLSE